MAEERDIPDFPTLLADIQGTMTRLDNSATQADAMSEIKNTVLPLMKDLVEAIMVFGEDVQDLVDPIKLTGAEAQDIKTLLTAYAQTQSGNPQLTERIESALESLDLEEDDGEGESDEEEAD